LIRRIKARMLVTRCTGEMKSNLSKNYKEIKGKPEFKKERVRYLGGSNGWGPGKKMTQTLKEGGASVFGIGTLCPHSGTVLRTDRAKEEGEAQGRLIFLELKGQRVLLNPNQFLQR